MAFLLSKWVCCADYKGAHPISLQKGPHTVTWLIVLCRQEIPICAIESLNIVSVSEVIRRDVGTDGPVTDICVRGV